jgi:hypothetical protein
LFALKANTTGTNCTAVGRNALLANTTGSNNTSVGMQAGNSVTTGGNNTFLGTSAGTDGTALTTGSNNIYLGYAAQASNAAESGAIVLGVNVASKGTNTAFINCAGGGGTYNAANTTTWATTSDRRLKKNIIDNNTGLSIISQIQVRNFEYRLPEEVTDLPQKQAIAKTGIQLGVIAQELQAVLPECVKIESTGVMTVDADNLTWYMINAIKELKAENDSLKARLDAAGL